MLQGSPEAVAPLPERRSELPTLVLTWQDLRSRGWSWQAPLAGVSYVAAPLVCLIAYVALSFREPEQETARPA